MATINDLPIEVQNELNAKRARLSKEWHESSQRFTKSANGTEIPNRVATKKEVLQIAKQIGTLVM